MPIFKKELPARQQTLATSEAIRQQIVRNLGFEDSETSCVLPPAIDAAAVDIDRSLFVHDEATLGSESGPFSLRATLGKLATQVPSSASSKPATAESLFLELWDTQVKKPGAGGNHHCDDEPSPVAGPNLGGVNGFPVHCRQKDGAQAATIPSEIDKYRPIALVNRLDLAHEGWRNCGEHRIIYGRTDGEGTHRNFIIFEAVLPNPKPGCRSACRPVMEFWAGLSRIPQPQKRQEALVKFFYEGEFSPGFRPVVHIDHYTAQGVGSSYGSSGSGQIRTNQFFELPWMLKEFRLLLGCVKGVDKSCSLNFVPTMVKVNPFGNLWNEDTAAATSNPFSALAGKFQADLLAGTPSAVAQLASKTFDGITYPVDVDFDAAESDSLTGSAIDDYLEAFNGSKLTNFRESFEAVAGASSSFKAEQLIRRAVGLSCAGCHQPSTFGLTAADAIGEVTLADGVTVRNRWPDSLGFVHVGEKPDAGKMFPLSPALTEVFLPSRKANLVARLQDENCQCEHTFVKLDPPKRAKAIEIQRGVVIDVVKPTFDELRKRFEGVSPSEALAVRVRLARSLQDMDTAFSDALATRLNEQGIRLEQLLPDLGPFRVELDLAGHKGDAQKARIQAVSDQVRSEPARRTVNGSFRAH